MVVVAVFVAAICPRVRADIGLLLNAKPNGPLRLHAAEITGEGHSAVYLSRVCPASPVQLRLCRPGELGSVIQNYKDFMEDQPYEWNAVPLALYLYGVEDMRDAPLFASPELRDVLQERYRAKYLAEACRSERCISSPAANWRDSVAAAFVREIYIFEVRTTVEQDEQFIREFNARSNVNHYSGFRRNCADFAKLVVNMYFPHSAHRDWLNDFGMTGPKAIARSFSHHAERRPDLEFRVVRIEQVPGTYKRSSDCHEGTEQTFRSKKWLVPMAVFAAHAVPVLAASYLLTGRFNPDHELRKRPSANAAALSQELADAKRAGDEAGERQLKLALRQERTRQLGGEQQWQQYRDHFEELLKTAVEDGTISNRRELRNVFRDLQARGRIYLDDSGQPWLQADRGGSVGLTRENILSTGSDSRLALRLLLARTDELISAKGNHRELWPEFQADWALLQRATEVVVAGSGQTGMASRASRK